MFAIDADYDKIYSSVQVAPTGATVVYTTDYKAQKLPKSQDILWEIKFRNGGSKRFRCPVTRAKA